MIKMKKMTVLIVLSFVSGIVLGQTEEKQILSGRDLLKTIRQQKGTSDKPNYEQRKQEQGLAKPAQDANIPAEKKAIEEKTPEKQKVAEQIITEVSKPQTELKQAVKQPAGDRLLSVIPPESVFILRVNNLDYALSQADILLGDISPMAMGLSLASRMEMANLFGSPDLKGINMAGSFALIGLPSSKQEQEPPLPSLYVLMPMKDYGLFSNGNPNVGKPDENKISKITADVNQTLIVKQMGNFALLAPENQYEDFKTFKEPPIVSQKTSIADIIEPDAMRNASSATIWLWINPQRLAEASGEDLPGQLAGLSIMTGGKLPLQTKEAESSQILKDLRSVSLAITPSAKMIKISGVINAVSGTETARILAADSPFMQNIIGALKAQSPKQSGPKLKEITSLISNARSADFIGTINLTDLVEVDSNIPMITADTTETEPVSNMVFALKYSDDKLSFDVAIPKEQLTAVAMAALPMMMVFGGQATTGPAMTFDMNSLGEMTFEGDNGLIETISLPKQTVTYEEEGGTIIAKPAQVDFLSIYGKSDGLFKLPLITMLPEEALSVTGGELKKAVGKNDEDLLPKDDFLYRNIHFPQLAEDKRTVEFTISIDYSNESITTVKVAEGTLEYLTSSGTEKKDSGPIDFMPGTWIEALGTTIQSISNSPLKENDTDITLQLNVEPQTILSAHFFSQDGKPLQAQQTGWSKFDTIYTITYTVSGRIPPAGKIIFEKAKDIQKHTIPFKARNLTLTIEKR